LPLPDKPSIAVLPFENMSGDGEQEFFADGMSEDIITGLSRYRSLFVIARNSAFAYKGQSPDLRDVARDLGVKYILEGSVRKGGKRIRITGQLIEGATGNHVWAERYDRDLDDNFAVRDEITEAIVAAIGPEIDHLERDQAQRLPPDNLDVWESHQRGLWHLYRFDRNDNAEAQRLFCHAIAQAPQFSPAHSGLTHALYYAFMHGHGDQQSILDEAYKTGRDAVAFDERDAESHFALGRILLLRREHEASIAEFETAISQNPSLAHAHLGLGTALLYSGIWDRAIECLDRTLRLSPHDPLLWLVNTARVMSLLGAGRLEEAEVTARLSTRLPNAAITAFILLAATLGQLGKGADAAMADVLARKPDIDVDYISRIFPFKNPDDLTNVVEGLHKAGMPR
jgi:adenylate cyclase